MELKPCECGEDINKTLRIEVIWDGVWEKVAVVYCGSCQRVSSFTSNPAESHLIPRKAIEAWNKRIGEE